MAGVSGAAAVDLVVRENSGEFVVALSGDCSLTTFRLPDRVAIAQFDAGHCNERAVARSTNRQWLYVGGRDGEISALSLPDLNLRRRQRLDHAIGHLLATSDERYLIAVVEPANAPANAPAMLVVLHGSSLAPARIVPLSNRRGQALTVAALTEVGHRQSVLISFEHSNEMWELFLAPDAETVFEGMVHDYRLGEGISEPRNLPIRRIFTDTPMEKFLVEPRSSHLSQLVDSGGASLLARRFNLDVRRQVGETPVLANIEFRTAVGVRTDHTSYWLAADHVWAGIHVHELPGMKYRGFIELPGAHCRALPPPSTQSIFIAACSDEGADQLYVIDAATQAVRAILQPQAGRRVSQIALSDKPGYVIAVLAGEAGQLVAYDDRNRCRIGEIAVTQLRKVVD